MTFADSAPSDAPDFDDSAQFRPREPDFEILPLSPKLGLDTKAQDMNRDESLLQDFPRPSRDAWEAATAKALRGKPSAALRWQTDDGIEFPPLFTAEDAASLPHQRVADLLHAPERFAIRQRIQTATPTIAARIAEQAIRGGATELALVFDQRSRLGLDPDADPDAEGLDGVGFDLDVDPGVDGCAIYHKDALATALGSIDLTLTRVAFDAGSSSLASLAMLLRVAANRGIEARALQLELGLDPIRDALIGTTGTDTSALLGECVTAIAATTGCPGITPLAVHSQPYHDAGAGAALEVACTLSTAIAYLRTLTAAGIHVDQALRAICLRVPVNTNIYTDVGKLRALRLLWAKVATAFGGTHTAVEIHAESSRRSWSQDDVSTNLLRTSVQAVLATLGTCDQSRAVRSDVRRNGDQDSGFGAEPAHSSARRGDARPCFRSVRRRVRVRSHHRRTVPGSLAAYPRHRCSWRDARRTRERHRTGLDPQRGGPTANRTSNGRQGPRRHDPIRRPEVSEGDAVRAQTAMR